MTESFLGRPEPPLSADTQAWWDATREHRLTVQRCRSCGHAQLYPRAICTSCGSTEVELADASGRGVVYSHTTVHRSPDPDCFLPPYVVALVRIEEGPLLLTNIVGTDPAEVRCDVEVEVTWEELADGRALPLFALCKISTAWLSSRLT